MRLAATPHILQTLAEAGQRLDGMVDPQEDVLRAARERQSGRLAVIRSTAAIACPQIGRRLAPVAIQADDSHIVTGFHAIHQHRRDDAGVETVDKLVAT